MMDVVTSLGLNLRLGTTAQAWKKRGLVIELHRCLDGQIYEAILCECVPVGEEEESCIDSYIWCAHIYAVQFDISASYCVQRSSAAGGIFSCFIHELINSAQNALLSSLTSAQPAVCLLGHSSLLAEGHRKQHKLCVQLYAPQLIWHDIRTFAMIKSPFILRPSPILSLLREAGVISPQLWFCLKRGPAGPLHRTVLWQFLNTKLSTSS